ncbi:MAG TPA: hypothetical protein VIY48_03080 [Candidatus Paceibacterota bacterium]
MTIEAERQLLEILARIRSDYEKAAKPFIDRLVLLLSMGRPNAVFITHDQAQELGFKLVKDIVQPPKENKID